MTKGKKTARNHRLLTPNTVPVTNRAEAKEAANVLRNHRREKALPTSGHKPIFAEPIKTPFRQAGDDREKARHAQT